jgi:hypothetical protein
MTVTSVSAVAVSFSTLTKAVPHVDVPPLSRPSTSAQDSVELSQQAAAEARVTAPAASRDETLLRALDTNRDGVVSRAEFSATVSMAIEKYTLAGRTSLPKV